MINSWSELFQAIKIWWHTPITVADIKKKIVKEKEPPVPFEDLLRVPKNPAFAKSYFDHDIYSRVDPYYANLKIDDSVWQDAEDEIRQLPPAKTPEEAKARREELIRRVRAKYGL